MKKVIYVLAAIFLIGTVGCAQGRQHQNGKRGAQTDSDRVKITVAIWNADQAMAGDAVLDAVEERFGVEFVPVNMTWNEYYQKVERWAATDSLPDIFVGDFRNSPLHAQWLRKGLLHEIPGDLSKYPHLEQYLNEVEEAQVPIVDGKMYCIPRKTYPSQEWTCIDRVVAYRWDLAQKAGITKEPETWEEFQQMMLAIVKADPEHTGIQGMTAENGGVLSGLLIPYASSVACCNGSGFYWKKDTDGVCKPVYFADDLTSAFELGRDMYQSGVIEKEIALQTANGAREKFLMGKNAAICYSGGFGNIYEKVGAYWEEVYGRSFMEDVRALKLMPDVNGRKAYPIWGYAWSESYISAKVDAEKLDRILQIYDYILSDEGAFYTSYGPEGDLYEIADNRIRMYDPDVSVIGKYPSCAMFSILARWDPSIYDDRFPARVPDVYIRVNQQLQQEAKDVPIPDHVPECSHIMMEEQIEFTLTVNDDFLRIITGAEPVEEIWEEIKGEYEAEGLQEVIDTVNERMRQGQ